jgi:hypothetical protein
MKLIERRIEKLEANRGGGMVLLWADKAEDMPALELEALERDPWASVLVIRWLS